MTRPASRVPGCFFLVFLLIGLVGTVVFGAVMIWPVVEARLWFEETTCVVLDGRIREQKGKDGPTYRAEVQIEYTVNGIVHRPWATNAVNVASNVRSEHEAVLRRFSKGNR